MKASIVIRTLNEARHLPELLLGIKEQRYDGGVEVIVVDSGSTDRTLEIAEMHHARIVHIKREEFSFGRSLNVGCEAATGGCLIFISGHCIPVSEHWLANLVAPLADGKAVYSYGRQIGNDSSRFSERQLFKKYFPSEDAVPQREGFFANNANSALLTTTWKQYKFDEALTGLEDMELAKRLVSDGQKVAYVASAPVFHLHDEKWAQVRRRYEREGDRAAEHYARGPCDVVGLRALLRERGAARLGRGATGTAAGLGVLRDPCVPPHAVLGRVPRQSRAT